MKKENIIGKICLNILILFIFLINNIWWNWCFQIEGICKYVNWSLFLIISIIVTICFWMKKDYRKTYIIFIIICSILYISNYFYYEKLSVKVESYLYLKQNYNIDYKDLEIVESWDNVSCFGCPETWRSIIYNYKENKIMVTYYKGKWYDSYKSEVSSYLQEYFDEHLEYIDEESLNLK